MTRVVVLSDLHLAIPGPLNNFHTGDTLASFLAEQVRPDTTQRIALRPESRRARSVLA
jgi:hypothetical protein